MCRAFSKANDINLVLMVFPLHELPDDCKLVPIQYQEYKNGLLYGDIMSYM